MGNKKNDTKEKYIRTINRCYQIMNLIENDLNKGINLDNVTLFNESLMYEISYYYSNFLFSLLYNLNLSVAYNYARSFLISICILDLSTNKERFDSTNYELFKDIALDFKLNDKKIDKICKKFNISPKVTKKCFVSSPMFYLFGADIDKLESRNIVNKLFISSKEIYLYDSISLYIHNLYVNIPFIRKEYVTYKNETRQKLNLALFNIGKNFERKFPKKIENPLISNWEDDDKLLKRLEPTLDELKEVVEIFSRTLSSYLLNLTDLLTTIYQTLLMHFRYKNYVGIVFSFKPLIENLMLLYFLSKKDLEDCATRLNYYDILTTYINTKDNVEISNIVKGKNDSLVSIIDDSYNKYYKNLVNYNFYDFKNIIYSDPTFLLLLNRDTILGRVEKMFGEILSKEDLKYMSKIYVKSVKMGHNDGFLYFKKDDYKVMSISIFDTINRAIDEIVDNIFLSINKYKDIKVRSDLLYFFNKVPSIVEETKKEIEKLIL